MQGCIRSLVLSSSLETRLSYSSLTSINTFLKSPSSESSEPEVRCNRALLNTRFHSGGRPVFVPIRAPENAGTETVSASEWKINFDELRAAITPKTTQIWINVR